MKIKFYTFAEGKQVPYWALNYECQSGLSKSELRKLHFRNKNMKIEFAQPVIVIRDFENAIEGVKIIPTRKGHVLLAKNCDSIFIPHLNFGLAKSKKGEG